MESERNDKIPTSSVVMKAIDAKTFSELEAFVKDLEARPIERLLRDLPGLISLSESKASIISYVLATKFRHADDGGRRTIRESVAAALARMAPGEHRDRAQHISDRIRGLENAPRPDELE